MIVMVAEWSGVLIGISQLSKTLLSLLDSSIYSLARFIAQTFGNQTRTLISQAQ